MSNLEHRLPGIRADWASRGFSFEYWIDPAGQVWRDFVHDVDELLMLIEGEIEIEFEGTALRPDVGEEVIIPANAKHTVSNPGDGPNRWCFGYKRSNRSRNG
jgi:mannose-6-phosphate isomerase-like protein (cupin superfamily)